MMKLLLSMILLASCSKSSTTKPGFVRVVGDPAKETIEKRKIAFEMQLPQASKPCPATEYLCFEPVAESAEEWTQTTVQTARQWWNSDQPIASLADARRWVKEDLGESYELRTEQGADQVGEDYYVRYWNLHGGITGVVKFSKGRMGYVAATCTGLRREAADRLHEICSTFKAL